MTIWQWLVCILCVVLSGAFILYINAEKKQMVEWEAKIELEEASTNSFLQMLEEQDKEFIERLFDGNAMIDLRMGDNAVVLVPMVGDFRGFTKYCEDCPISFQSAKDKCGCGYHWRPKTGTKAGFPRPDGWNCPRDTFERLLK